MPVRVIYGNQRGDEGKGRFVDMLAAEHDIGARFNGGDNAGHTVSHAGEVYKLHGLPTTIVHPHAKSVIGNGAVVNAVRLIREIENLQARGIEVSPRNLLISSGAHLVLPHYISEDEIRETGIGKQGSTKSGIAQGYGEKAYRRGVRAEIINNDADKLFELARDGLLSQREQRLEAGLEALQEDERAREFISCARKLGEFVTDTALFLNRELRKEVPARVLAEGAQAFLLDIDHGMYPYTTSSNTIVGGASTGLGIPPMLIDRVIGVTKAVQSHVGGGPFVTEIHDQDLLAKLYGNMESVDAERGTTTGRTRRLGYLDLPQLRRSHLVNGTDLDGIGEMALTKLDWVQRFGKVIPICVEYERKGKILKVAPAAAYQLDQSVPIYEEVEGWEDNIQNIRQFDDLPAQAQSYIQFIEEQTGVPITMIGVGPDREQVIIRTTA